MNVVNYLVYRVVSIEKTKGIYIGDSIPIPIERDDFDGCVIKNDIENLFENVRKEYYPGTLSRKSCLFVLPYDEEKVLGWIKGHHPHDDYDFALLTLRLTGTLLWKDEDIFTTAGCIPSLRNQLAKEYWDNAGDKYDSFETPEGLFCGEAIVDEVAIRRYIADN